MKLISCSALLVSFFFLFGCSNVTVGDVLPSSPELDVAFLELVKGRTANGTVMWNPAPTKWSVDGRTFVLTVQPPIGGSIKTTYTLIKALNYTAASYNDGKGLVEVIVQGNTVTIPSGMGTMKLTFN